MSARGHGWGWIGGVALALCVVRPVAAAPSSSKGKVLQDREARVHFERAQQHFAAEDYAAAIPELKAAYALEPNPLLLYAWAQAERLSGSCTRAVELYRRFLDTKPATEQRQLAEANLLDCEAERASAVPEPEPELEPMPATEPEPVAADPAPVRPEADEPPRRWYADPLGGVLMGVGVASSVSGGVVMGVAASRAAQAPRAAIEDDYVELSAQVQRMNIGGVVALGVGSALLVGGIIRYAVVAKRGKRAGPTVHLRWAPQGGLVGVGWGRRF